MWRGGPGRVDLGLQAMAEACFGRALEANVVAVGARAELSHRTEPGVDGLAIREGSKASLADRLESVHLSGVRLIDGSRANVLRSEIQGCAELPFHAKTPLHEVGRVQLARGNGRDRNRCQTTGWIRARRGTGEPAPAEPGLEAPMSLRRPGGRVVEQPVR
mgnify:CR=1 FL=1